MAWRVEAVATVYCTKDLEEETEIIGTQEVVSNTWTDGLSCTWYPKRVLDLGSLSDYSMHT